MERPRIDDNLPASPVQALLFQVLKALAPTDDEQAIIVEGDLAEYRLCCMRLREVAKLPEPIDDLAVAVVEAIRPLKAELLAHLPEDAVRSRIFKLDKREFTLLPVADSQVGRVTAEEVEFTSNPIDMTNIMIEISNHRRNIAMVRKEGQDKLAYL